MAPASSVIGLGIGFRIGLWQATPLLAIGWGLVVWSA